MIGVIFQDYKLFALPVIDNVLMGGKQPEKTAVQALEKAGLLEKIREHPLGRISRFYSKEFDADGIEFSGGEMQKLALARLFARNAPILLLDEPSAALDPAAEYALFTTVTHLAHNKTIIFISHRLSAAKTADVIYVIDKATVKESGDHRKLMALRGLYWEMFTKQATAYHEELC